MGLDLSPFEGAIRSLREAFAQCDIQPTNKLMRDGAIQRFEYTYELAWKFLRRFLSRDLGKAELERLGRKDLFREGFRMGYLADAEPWFGYHEARNQTSHTYNEARAKAVFEAARRFLDDADRLLGVLNDRNS